MASSEAAYQELDWDLGIIVDQSKDFIQQETNVAADRYQDAKILFLVLTIVVLVLSVSIRFIPVMKRKWRQIKNAQIALGYYSEKGLVAKLTSSLRVF